MIQKDQYGAWEVWCDRCPEDQSFDHIETFSELISEMKDAGWFSKKEDEEWIHLCPACASAPLEIL